VSVQLWTSCCCDCVWRQAYLCSDDSATGKYAEDADIDVTKVYEIADGCVYFAGCYETNGGTEAVILSGPYDDCDECDSPAPCECPEDLLESYLVTGDLDAAGEGICAISRTVSTSGECSWSSPSEDPPECELAIVVSLDTSEPCRWIVEFEGAVGEFEKLGGDTPVGPYTLVSEAAGYDYSNIEVS
jgi:hypothetical protein